MKSFNCDVFNLPTDNESTNAKDIIIMLRSEIAYLKGKISVYEKFLTVKGYIKEKIQKD